MKKGETIYIEIGAIWMSPFLQNSDSSRFHRTCFNKVKPSDLLGRAFFHCTDDQSFADHVWSYCDIGPSTCYKYLKRSDISSPIPKLPKACIAHIFLKKEYAMYYKGLESRIVN